MTSHTGRLYSLALALVVFFLVWVVIAARPWATAAATRDPRLAALQARELRLRSEAKLVDRVVARRWAAYRLELRARNAQIAVAQHRAAQAATAQVATAQAVAAPAVRIVTLPPLTITRTS